ncbi:MAG: CYTH domain-containing protein [Bacteroidales bacterium]|nr:CYTH domain-containing protein [Bacteroidales bacterium]
MGVEIERKFLIIGDYKHLAKEVDEISQGYLSLSNEQAVRIRVSGEKGYITIKGMGNKTGVSREEWEYEIPVSDALELLRMCKNGIIRKNRYLIDFEGKTFEVDEFSGDNEGLVVAELELNSENEPFEKPSWLGREITGEDKYYNLMLVKHPFKDW